MYRPTIRIAEDIGSVLVVLLTIFVLVTYYVALGELFNAK